MSPADSPKCTFFFLLEVEMYTEKVCSATQSRQHAEWMGRRNTHGGGSISFCFESKPTNIVGVIASPKLVLHYCCASGLRWTRGGTPHVRNKVRAREVVTMNLLLQRHQDKYESTDTGRGR